MVTGALDCKRQRFMPSLFRQYISRYGAGSYGSDVGFDIQKALG
jgi:hypothetical protein